MLPLCSQFPFIKIKTLISFGAVLGLHCCTGFSLVASEGYFLGVGFSLLWLVLLWSTGLRACSCSMWAQWSRLLGSRAQANSCGTWAQLHHGIWDLPWLGIKSASPASAGRFFTSEPPGKPTALLFNTWPYCSFFLNRIFLMARKG